MPLILGIDASTQSCSATVIDTNKGVLVAEESVNFGRDLPQYHAPNGFIVKGSGGVVHSDPLMWLDALDVCLERLAGRVQLGRVAAISGAGQQHGTVYLNAHWRETVGQLESSESLAEQIEPCLSRATSPIWMDTSTTQQCRAIAEAVGGDAIVCQKSGSVAIERFSGPQIRRFFEEHPDNYAHTDRIHLVSSFICSVLAGADAPIDYGDGAGMNLLNLESRRWDTDLLKATAKGLLDKLPDVVPSQTLVGSIAPYFCQKYGFHPDTRIITFTGDNPSSLVGMGAATPGKIVISLGTSDTIFAALPTMRTDPDGYGHVFGNPLGGSMTLQCFINGSLAREQVKDRFGMTWETFSQALQSTPAGNAGNRMAPFFGPEISPRVVLPDPILSGTRQFEAWEDAPAAVRACVEGQFLNMRQRSRWMGLQTNVLYLTGGASQNDQIAQIAADVFAARVERLAVSGSVGLGAALRAAIAACDCEIADLQSKFCQPEPGSTLSPNREASALYADLGASFDALWLKHATRQ